MDITEEDLQPLYTWVSSLTGSLDSCAAGPQVVHQYIMHAQVDEIPLSRPKRNIARDFSDGGEMCAKGIDGLGCLRCPFTITASAMQCSATGRNCAPLLPQASGAAQLQVGAFCHGISFRDRCPMQHKHTGSACNTVHLQQHKQQR